MKNIIFITASNIVKGLKNNTGGKV